MQTTNRENTGLSVVHCHYIACQMEADGFQPREHAKGHDLPVVVRESSGSDLGRESVCKWLKALDETRGFPPLQVDPEMPGLEIFCSLGNGHFFQSLNLFGTRSVCLFGEGEERAYSMDSDARLQKAVHEGVASIVLKPGITRKDRKFVSLMLNSAFEYQWIVNADGTVRIDPTGKREASLFDGMTKTADAFELGALVQQHIKLKADRKRASQARTRSNL